MVLVFTNVGEQSTAESCKALWSFRLDIWPYSVFLINRRLWVEPDEKSLQGYPVNAGVSQGSILVFDVSYNMLVTFMMMLFAI